MLVFVAGAGGEEARAWEAGGLERTMWVSMVWRESLRREGTMLTDRVHSCTRGHMECAKVSYKLLWGKSARVWYILR